MIISDLNSEALSVKTILEKSFEENASGISLIYNQTCLTYHELNTFSNKIAHYLVANGVTSESLVPICLYSGIELIAGLIGILKAGGAYVPVDPFYPDDRIRYILNDCNSDLIVSTSNCTARLEKLTAAKIFEIDKELSSLDNWPDKNPVIELAPENLAYVMYTSGTTGVPNGVMIEHHSLVNKLLWAKNYFKINVNDFVLQKTTFCFDVSVWEILWPLISGAKLVIIENERYRDIQSLINVIALHKITVVHFVPTMLEFFLLSISSSELPSLKWVISSGEPLSVYQANLLKSKLTGAALVNLYGPTETTIHSSYWLAPTGNGEIGKVFIGKPIQNTEILIINEQNNCQDIGAIGEVFISGEGLARGYLNKPELTSARFVVGNFKDAKTKKYYKTGDYGRFAENGDIEYLGRMDDQVKINGYRIELESIEINIKNSGLVKHAVVLTRVNTLKIMQILAYVVLKKQHSLQQLWDYLVIKLPGYMLPTKIKDVENIPFTANGKVDKSLLFQLTIRDEANTIIIGPRNEPEAIVMAVWKELFKDFELSVYSNFFDIGGNSIMAVKMLSVLKKQTGKHISFLQLNQFPTIESLAKLLSKQKQLKINNILVSITPQGNKPPLYLINGGELVYDGFFNLSDEMDEDQPVYGFQSNGFDSNGKIFENIPDVASFYVKGILNQDERGPYAIAGYSLGGTIAFEMAKQLKAMGKEVKLLAMIDSITRDPELIKTKHNVFTMFRIIYMNIYLFKYGFSRGFNFSRQILRASVNTIKNKYLNQAAKKEAIPQLSKPGNLDVFGLHIDLYKKYRIEPYEGNIVIFRASEITFYMDDFKYLGWKPYARKIKSISIKGHHYSIFDNENIKDFGEKLQKVLDEGF